MSSTLAAFDVGAAVACAVCAVATFVLYLRNRQRGSLYLALAFTVMVPRYVCDAVTDSPNYRLLVLDASNSLELVAKLSYATMVVGILFLFLFTAEFRGDVGV